MANDIWEAIDATGYANGDKFTSEEEVREYFTVENIRDMFSECDLDQETLSEYATEVIEARRHCKF